MSDDIIFWLCAASYLLVGSVVGGYVYTLFSNKYDHEQPLPVIAGIFWPGMFLWWLMIKPISKLGIRLGNWKIARAAARQENLRLIRRQLERAQYELDNSQREYRELLAASEKEVEHALTSDQYSPAALRHNVRA